MPLALGSQPGFTEIPDNTFDSGNPLTAASLKSLNADAKFATVRSEEYWGFYKNGETVVLPVSPADGYAYARNELFYIALPYWSGGAPGGDLLGTHALPARGATGGAGQLLQFGYYVDQATGLVKCDASYYKDGGAQSNTHDGILLVITLAKRLR